MNKIIFLTLFFSCATTEYKDRKEDYKEPAVCRNTLQQGIHRNECMR